MNLFAAHEGLEEPQWAIACHSRVVLRPSSHGKRNLAISFALTLKPWPCPSLTRVSESIETVCRGFLYAPLCPAPTLTSKSRSGLSASLVESCSEPDYSVWLAPFVHAHTCRTRMRNAQIEGGFFSWHRGKAVPGSTCSEILASRLS
jgi:hypothetical protein